MCLAFLAFSALHCLAKHFIHLHFHRIQLHITDTISLIISLLQFFLLLLPPNIPPIFLSCFATLRQQQQHFFLAAAADSIVQQRIVQLCNLSLSLNVCVLR